MNFFWNLISVIGGTTAIIASAGFLAKGLAQHWLTRDLERFKGDLSHDAELYKSELVREVEEHKAKLVLSNSQALEQAKFNFQQQLLARRGEIDLFRDEVKQLNESEQERNSRLHAQIQRWANPIGLAITDLEHRLSNIIDNGGYQVLASEPKVPLNWSADYKYFMGSTLYYFAQYFCWVRLLQHQLSYELFRSTSDMQVFLGNIESVASELGRFPYGTEDDQKERSTLIDSQVFRLQQRAIGELLLDKTSPSDKLLSYKDFYDEWLDRDETRVARHLQPLENFLLGIRPDNDLRWKRLTHMRDRLRQFREACNETLRSA